MKPQVTSCAVGSLLSWTDSTGACTFTLKLQIDRRMSAISSHDVCCYSKSINSVTCSIRILSQVYKSMSVVCGHRGIPQPLSACANGWNQALSPVLRAWSGNKAGYKYIFLSDYFMVGRKKIIKLTTSKINIAISWSCISIGLFHDFVDMKKFFLSPPRSKIDIATSWHWVAQL